MRKQKLTPPPVVLKVSVADVKDVARQIEVDHVFMRFKDRIDRDPAQILRFDRVC